MIIKKKLRDITKEEFRTWASNYCKIYDLCCTGCPFKAVQCLGARNELPWYDNKEMFSDKFLNQEIDIEVPSILDDVEKRYLSSIIKPFRERVVCIEKGAERVNTEFEYIAIGINSLDTENVREYIELPYFKTGTMYQGIELEKTYTLEELGL